MPETVITKYPFVLVTLATRKEGVTLEQFRHHNETVYAPLVKKVLGKVHPLAWMRRYHVEEGEGPKGVPRFIIGADDGLTWDCWGEMVCALVQQDEQDADHLPQTFADELHCQQFLTFLHSEEAEPVLEEEGKFADPEKTRLFVMRREHTIGERAEVQKLE